MKIERNNILVVGLLSTGSSALIDILREYKNIHTIPGEFNDFRAPGLVADQLNYEPNSYFKNEINKLTKFKIKIDLIYRVVPVFSLKISLMKGMKDRFNYSYTRLRQLNLLKKLNAMLTSDISFENKIKFANQWIFNIGNINSRRKEYIVFNQPLLTVNEISIWKRVFYPWKLIIVYRNPIDQLAEIIKNEKLFSAYSAPYLNVSGVILETIYGRGRKSAINFHIEAMKKRFEWIDLLKKELKEDDFLLIDFEGLVNNYNKYNSIVENFLGIKNTQHINSKLYFDPQNAQKSINIYKGILTDEEIKLLSGLEDWYLIKLKNNHILD